jgi:hypothetical protein
VYEAKPGKKLGTATVESEAADCPSFVSYNPNDPKYYLYPSDDSISAAVLNLIK